jgi:hypothetical protein
MRTNLLSGSKRIRESPSCEYEVGCLIAEVDVPGETINPAKSEPSVRDAAAAAAG